VKTDAEGRNKLVVNGELQWDDGRRDTNKGLGLFIAMETANEQSEWSAYSWDPNGRQWNFFSSNNVCKIKDMLKCARSPRDFIYDKTWKKKGLSEERKSIKFSSERDFRHSNVNRVLKLGETRMMRAGFVKGEWEQYGVSKDIKLQLADSANAVDFGDWEPPSEDEFFVQEWDEDGHPIVSDEEWEDWEEENFEVVENADEVPEEGADEDDEWADWEDDEEIWMTEQR